MAWRKNAGTARGFGAALQWRPDGDKFRLLAFAVLLVFAGYAAVFVALTVIRQSAQPGGDFFALWSSARLLWEQPAAQIYDPAVLTAAQLALGMDPGSSYPFPYPPHFLLLLWPLGLLPLGTAYVVAIGGTLALYVWATVGSHWRSPMTVAALLAPTTTITAIAGQAGFLAAALLIGGFRLAGWRPVLAGILFGLATYKPQMGILVPVALLAAGLWRTVIAACITAALLAAATAIAFGAGIWSAWIANIVHYSDQFAAESSAILHLMPTVSAALMQLGAPPLAVHLGQFAAAIAAAGTVWYCCRAGLTPLSVASVFVATFLASPHAFVYDMPPVTTAVLWVVAERQHAGDTFGMTGILVLLLAMMSPVALVAGPSQFPVVPLSLALLLVMIATRCRRNRRSGISPVAFGAGPREV